MAMVDDKVSPEEKLLNVIKGGNVPVPPKIVSPVTGSKTGFGSSVVPPLSSVLNSIINAPSSARSGSPVAFAMPVKPAVKTLSFQEQQAMIKNLAATYSVAPLQPAPVPTTQTPVRQPSPAPVQHVAVPVSSEAPKPQPVVQPVAPVKAAFTAPAKAEVAVASVNDRPVSRVPLPEQTTAQKPAAVPVAVPVAVVAPIGKSATPVIPASGVVQPAVKSAVSPPAAKAVAIAQPAAKPAVSPPAGREVPAPVPQPVPKPVAPPVAAKTVAVPVAQPMPKPVVPPASKVESKPVTAAPVQPAKPVPQAVKEQPKPAAPVAAVAPPKPSAPQPVQKTESKPAPSQPAAAPRTQVSPVAPKPAEAPKPAAPVAQKPVPVEAKSVEAKAQPKPEIKPTATIAAKPPVPSEKPKVAVPAPVEEKPKLKIAKSDAPAVQEAAKPSEAKVKAKAISVEEPGDMALPPPVMIAKKPEEKKRYVIRNVNLGLVAAILLLIAFSVNEMFAKLRTDEQLNKVPGTSAPVVPDQDGKDAGPVYQLPALETIVQGMGDRPMLSMPGQKVKETPVEGAEKAPQLMDWMKYVQDSVKLMGFSGSQVDGTQQAIIQEGKDKDSRINFFKPGEKVQIQGRDIQVESVRDDQVILTDGKRKMTLK